MPKLFNIGVKALIRNKEGRYLLLKADTTNHNPPIAPYWDIPGGRIEEGDDSIATLRREIAEETGITTVTDISLLTSVISSHEFVYGEKMVGIALFIYTVHIPEDAVIKLNETEHTEYAWFDKVEAAELLASKYPPAFTAIIA